MVRGEKTSRAVRTGSHGAVLLELVVAIAVLGAAVIPLAFLFAREGNLCRAYYWRAVAMEVVDGEMEVLAAGEWRGLSQGTHPYTVRARAAESLPPGRFVATLRGDLVRLEWLPDRQGGGGRLSREERLE